MAAAQWKARAGRSVALLAMIAVSIAAFTLLTGAAETSRLKAVGTVHANYRPAYDILVRPQNAVLPLEEQRGLVQSGQLAGLRGGITDDQWRQIQAVDGVDIAAPVAVIGYIMRTVPVPIDLTADLDPTATRQVLRVRPTWVTDAGLTRIPDGHAFLYATRNRLDQRPWGELRSGERPSPPEEVEPDGARRTVCPFVPVVNEEDWIDPTDLRGRSSLTCVGGPGSVSAMGGPTRPTVSLAWSVPFLMAAIDPSSEARLAGLDGAVTQGRYFTPGEKPRPRRLDGMRYPYEELPILISDRAQVDAELRLDVERLGDDAVDLVVAATDDRKLRAKLSGRSGTKIAASSIPIAQPYRQMVDRMLHPRIAGEDMSVANTLWLGEFWTVGPRKSTQEGDELRVEPVRHDLKIWGKGADAGEVGHPVPMEFADTGVRGQVAVHRNNPDVGELQVGDVTMPDVALTAVGTFDPRRVELGGALSAVPMDTYFNPGAEAADDASRTALGAGRLEPNANVTGLLSQPPLALTTMAALPSVMDYSTEPGYPEYALNRAAPISVVRVRLVGEVGMDAVSRERVRLVAERIAERTGLRVDITLGSSPTGVTVHYPAGRFGRPELAVAEPWVRKGVAAELVRAADRKSVLLAGLVLAVCALAVLNANRAAVRARRTDLGILACVGWTRRQLLLLLWTEMTGIGLAAGVAGLLIALPLSFAFGLSLSARSALLVVPAAVGLAVLAGAWPAWRAARADPGAVVRPAVSMVTRRWRLRRVTGLAVAGLVRTPGRTVLAAASVTIGVGAFTMLLAITFAFRGSVTGTLLGEAISLEARTIDYLAVAITVVLGVVSVADVMYLNVSERSSEFALLTAVGWEDSTLRRLVVTEAAVIGVLGGAAGAAAGLVGASVFSGAVTSPLVWCAFAAFAAGVAVVMLAVAVPVVQLRRLPVALVLAEE